MDNSTEQMINWVAYWRYFHAFLTIPHHESDYFLWLQPVHAGHEQTDSCDLAAQSQFKLSEVSKSMKSEWKLASHLLLSLPFSWGYSLTLVVVLQLRSCIWWKCLVLLLPNHKVRRVKYWSSPIQWFSHLSPPSFLSHCVANKEYSLHLLQKFLEE